MPETCKLSEQPCPSMIEEEGQERLMEFVLSAEYDRLYEENNRLRMYLCASLFLLFIGTFFAYGFWPR